MLGKLKNLPSSIKVPLILLFASTSSVSLNCLSKRVPNITGTHLCITQLSCSLRAQHK
uniref:6 kDa protein n=1 Tax=Autographa californica nuclear polyhedrosis virus TaxID=46015 RepID=Q64802_NPVAC|nr:6 kDa protein [Autographa californica nucleopolyhedrovirus]